MIQIIVVTFHQLVPRQSKKEFKKPETVPLDIVAPPSILFLPLPKWQSNVKFP